MEKEEYRTVLGAPNEVTESLPVQRPTRQPNVLLWIFLILAIIFVYWGYIRMTPPQNFAPNTLIEIPSGFNVQSIGRLLRDQSIIRSPLLFSILVTYYGNEKNVRSGEYLFKEPAAVWVVARRLASGDHGIETKKVTLPEGFTTKEMSDIFERTFPNFDSSSFLEITATHEGYLFPDTYFFFSTATSGEIATTLEGNFITKTNALYQETLTQKKNWANIVTMASILEGEAVTHDDRRIISGILWKRILKGMRLQVDTTFMYINGKASSELTVDDLKIDSPYNTYRYPGLPPGPIGNPGLDALDAALNPTSTPYFYYLSDKDGVMHYARTFDEHKTNKLKYLK